MFCNFGEIRVYFLKTRGCVKVKVDSLFNKDNFFCGVVS